MKERPRLTVATARECDKEKHRTLGRIYALWMTLLIAGAALFNMAPADSVFFMKDFEKPILLLVFVVISLLSWLIFWESEETRKSTSLDDDAFARFSSNLQTCLSIQECRNETRWFIKQIEKQKRRPIVKEAEMLEDFTNHFKSLYWEEVFMTQMAEKWKKAPPILQDAA